jgi:two-component system, cell cycle sensor histidine kinase and response regulator CckA
MSATTSPVQPPTRTILLVEDEDSVRQVTRCVLESAGYLVLEAASAEQAMAVFYSFEGSINLLLTDVVMPSMSGAELAMRLKATHPGFITILMSGYAGTAGLGPGLGPPDYFIQKPFSINFLLARVAEALSPPLNRRQPSVGAQLPI